MTPMANETLQLAQYAAQVSFDDLPAHVIQQAKDCLIDAVAVGYRGSAAGWIPIVKKFVGAPGVGSALVFAEVIGPARAETAALVNAILIHALEMDTLRKPGVGVHPGATVVPAALAVAQERALSGKHLLTAIVAGCETLIRIGRATKGSVEPRGFHAPAVTGPFGATAAAGRLFELDPATMANAFGIAGSMSGGLLQFSSGGGPLVKRLHVGRAAEAGVSSARWAACGMAGPSGVLEGKYGLLNGFCGDRDDHALTAGLGEQYETSSICFKRYACHITAHMPVFAIEQLRAEYGFKPGDIARIVVRASQRVVDHNSDPHPSDPNAASYSIPFCVAVAIYGNQKDPDSFGEASLRHEGMRALRDRIRVEKRQGSGGHSDWAAEVQIELKDGTLLRRLQQDFPGTPTMPLTNSQLQERFMTLIAPVCGERGSEALWARLATLEQEDRLDWLGKLAVRPRGSQRMDAR
jgi:2-methylcitrate dehydratase PrpD